MAEKSHYNSHRSSCCLAWLDLDLKKNDLLFFGFFYLLKYFMQYVLILFFPLPQLLLDRYPLNFIFLFLSQEKENEREIININ